MKVADVSFSHGSNRSISMIAGQSPNKAELTDPNIVHNKQRWRNQRFSTGQDHKIQMLDTIHVHFIRYPKIHDFYIQIIDDQTNKVIREVPPKQVLDRYAAMMERFGLISDKKGKVK